MTLPWQLKLHSVSYNNVFCRQREREREREGGGGGGGERERERNRERRGADEIITSAMICCTQPFVPVKSVVTVGSTKGYNVRRGAYSIL